MPNRVSWKIFSLFVTPFCISVLIVLQVVSIITTNNWNNLSIKDSSFDETHEYSTGDTAERNDIKKQNIAKDANFRKILLWTPLFKSWNYLPQGRSSFSQCHETRCLITTSREEISSSDAILFHIRTLALYDLPVFRKADQKWIFFTMESPPNTAFSGFPFMSTMFNWTMTYRQDSDIVIQYGRINPQEEKQSNSLRDLGRVWKQKTKMAVWLVSNCETDGQRELYVDSLQKYIDVDIFGSCGVALCPEGDSCLQAFAKKYKFYLSFENSICVDYVTEKFFRVLKYDIVPIVFGGANYSHFAPPQSFINALEYTPRQLGQYLKYLASNSSHYFQYLKWKENTFDIRDMDKPCALCEKLHSNGFKEHSSYKDMTQWWIGDSRCEQWTNQNNFK